MSQTIFTGVKTVEAFKDSLKAKNFKINTNKEHGHWFFTCAGQIGHVSAKLDTAITEGQSLEDIELLVGWSKWTDRDGNPIIDQETGAQREGWTLYFVEDSDDNCVIL